MTVEKVEDDANLVSRRSFFVAGAAGIAALMHEGIAATAAENAVPAPPGKPSVKQSDVFHHLDTMTTIKPAPNETTAAKIVSGQNMTMLWVDVPGNTHRAPHVHPHEQFTWLLSGRMDYRVGDGPVTSCGPGTVLTIPPNIEHEVWYREDCRYAEVFSPVQEAIGALAKKQN